MSSATKGSELPEVTGSPPGPGSRALSERLGGLESRNVTFRSEAFPIFWDRAEGSNVWDVDGNRYVDLTAGFGVAATGHSHPRVVAAIREQTQRLVHGMGDVHPPSAKVALLERLAAVAPMSDVRTVLCTSGSEAVEVALKTACLATGKPGALAFTGGYHGLTYGALSVTDREFFRAPFEAQLNPHVLRLDFPHPYRVPERYAPGARPAEPRGADLREAALEAVRETLGGAAGERVGAVIVEPIQGRGGDVIPPPGFLAGLGRLCREAGILLILDEIYTGFGRTGEWFACQSEEVEPDLVCVGKAFSGSMPIAACIGRRDVMEAWPASRGEAMHTTTFLGHPVACAAAAAAMAVIEEEGLVRRAREVGDGWLEALRARLADHPSVGDVRGRGLMIGLDLVAEPTSRRPARRLAARAVEEALRRGWILLPAGPDGNVLSLSPPLNVASHLLERAVDLLDAVLADVGSE